MKYREKPVVIEAKRLDDSNDAEPLTRAALESMKRRWKQCGPGWDVWLLVAEVERLWGDRIRWSEGDGFDPAYDHDYSRGDSQCVLCEISQCDEDGSPCPNKADLVAYYVPKPVNPLEPKDTPWP